MSFHNKYSVLFSLVFMFWLTPSVAGNLSSSNLANVNSYQRLLDKFQTIRTSLESNQFGEPVYIESDFDNDLSTGHVYALLSHQYETVLSRLIPSDNWCSVAMLHINVKGCESQLDNKQKTVLTLYVGNKNYQVPDNAYPVNYRYEIQSKTDNFMSVNLLSEDGPFGTSDYNITFEAIPFGKSSSFIHFSFSYRNGFIAKLALKTYLATTGSQKVGFSMQGYDANSHPMYVKGMQGVIERNAMRYYLAIQSFLDTSNDDQLRQRIIRWFDLTQRFSKQLYEIPRADYIEMKNKEFSNNIRSVGILSKRE